MKHHSIVLGNRKNKYFVEMCCEGNFKLHFELRLFQIGDGLRKFNWFEFIYLIVLGYSFSITFWSVKKIEK